MSKQISSSVGDDSPLKLLLQNNIMLEIQCDITERRQEGKNDVTLSHLKGNHAINLVLTGILTHILEVSSKMMQSNDLMYILLFL